MTDAEVHSEIATAIVDRWRIAMTEEATVLGTARSFAEAAMPSVRRYAEDFAAVKLREVALWMELNGYDDAAVDDVIRRARRLTNHRQGTRPTIDPCKRCHPELWRSQCWEGGCVAVTEFRPCGKAPIGVVTNCTAMNCERDGCAMARPQVPVSLDDLTDKGI